MFNKKGYVGQSMSVRAENAYDDGLLSKAKIKKYDLEEAEINLSVSFVKWLMPDVIKPSEWHHTGKHYNETDFYDMEDVKEQLESIDTENLFEHYKKEQEEKEKLKAEKGYYAFVEFGEWEGTRKHPKLVTYKAYAFIKGKWAYIDEFRKKKIDGKHFRIIKTYKIKPKDMNSKIRDNIFKRLKDK